MIGREIDPDHDISAYIGAVLTAVALLFLPLPWVFPVGTVVVLLRVVNGTVGLPPLWNDYGVPLLGAALAIGWDKLWPLGIVVALGFVLNGLLPRPQRALGFGSAALMLILAAVIYLLTPRATVFMSLSTLHIVLGVLTTLLFFAVLLLDRKFESVVDVGGEAVIPARIQAGRALALLAALALTVGYGGTGFIAMLPVWLAMLGVGLRFLAQRQ